MAALSAAAASFAPAGLDQNASFARQAWNGSCCRNPPLPKWPATLQHHAPPPTELWLMTKQADMACWKVARLLEEQMS